MSASGCKVSANGKPCTRHKASLRSSGFSAGARTLRSRCIERRSCMCASPAAACLSTAQSVLSGSGSPAALCREMRFCRSPASAHSRTMTSSLSSRNESAYRTMLGCCSACSARTCGITSARRGVRGRAAVSAAIASPMSFTRSSPNLVDLGKGGARATQRTALAPLRRPRAHLVDAVPARLGVHDAEDLHALERHGGARAAVSGLAHRAVAARAQLAAARQKRSATRTGSKTGRGGGNRRAERLCGAFDRGGRGGAWRRGAPLASRGGARSQLH